MIKAIKVLQDTHREMGEVLKFLEEYEDGVDADYSSVTIDYRWLLQELKHRQTTLKKREGINATKKD